MNTNLTPHQKLVVLIEWLISLALMFGAGYYACKVLWEGITWLIN